MVYGLWFIPVVKDRQRAWCMVLVTVVQVLHRFSCVCKRVCTAARLFSVLRLLAPLVLLPNASLLLRRKVVLNVEGLSDLLWRLALDHGGHLGTGQVQ